MMSMFRHADQFKQVHRLFGTLDAGIMSAVIHRQQDILDRGQRGQELEELEDDADRTVRARWRFALR